jgi:hypothetical protein
MVSQMWYPDKGDRIVLLDGTVGGIGDRFPEWDFDAWKAQIHHHGENMGIRKIAYSPERQQWEEVDD